MLNPSQILTEGAQIENFTIQRKLGRGGFGVTYLATEFARSTVSPASESRSGIFQRSVAIKEFFPEGLAWRAEQSRVIPAQKDGAETAFFNALKAFMQEANTIAQLDHHNVVRIHGVFESHGTAYFVMPYLQGPSLKGWLRQHGALEQDEIERLVLPVLDGLEEVHGLGVIHRDLKPDNIMIREGNNRPVLIDFGAARTRAADDARQYTRISELVAYTPGYAPIEQYARATSDNRHNPSTDLYAYCATLYECVTGRPPPESALRSLEVQTGRPDPMPPASAQASDRRYTPALLEAIDWGLRILPDDRPQTVAELRACIIGARPVPTRMSIPAAAAPAAAKARPGVPPVPGPERSRMVAAPAASPPIGEPAAAAPLLQRQRTLLLGLAGVIVLAGAGALMLSMSGSEEAVETQAATTRVDGPETRQRASDARAALELLLPQLDAALAGEQAPPATLNEAQALKKSAEAAYAAGRYASAADGFDAARDSARQTTTSYLGQLRDQWALLASNKLDAGDTTLARAALNRAKQVDQTRARLGAAIPPADRAALTPPS